MFALGIGNQIVMEELIGIASDPFIDDDGNNVTFVFMATDFNALLSIRNQLRDAACDVTAGMFKQEEVFDQRLFVVCIFYVNVSTSIYFSFSNVVVSTL